MRTITVVTEIAAPVGAVWTHLLAVEEYPDWNPFITAFRGEVAVGHRAEIRIAPPGERPITFRPVVTQVEDGRRLEWFGRLVLPGLFDGRHSFELEPLGGDGSRLTHSEEFRGLLVPLMGSALERTRAGFAAMNDALRRRVEEAERSARARNRR